MSTPHDSRRASLLLMPAMLSSRSSGSAEIGSDGDSGSNKIGASSGIGNKTAAAISTTTATSSGGRSTTTTANSSSDDKSSNSDDDDDSGDREKTSPTPTTPFNSAHDADGDILSLSSSQQSPHSSLLAERRASLDANLSVSRLLCHGLPVPIEKVSRSMLS
jgi:hypothetical protein